MPEYEFICVRCQKPALMVVPDWRRRPKWCKSCSDAHLRMLTPEREVQLRLAYRKFDLASEALNYCESQRIFQGISRKTLKSWAIKLKITKWRNFRCKWTPEELSLLENLTEKHPRVIQRILAEKGIQRSQNAIKRRIYFMGCQNRPDGYTPDEVAEIVGGSGHWIRKLIHQGYIKASRFSKEKSVLGSHRWIAPRDLAMFLRNWPELLEGRVLEFGLIVSLLDEHPSGKRNKKLYKAEKELIDALCGLSMGTGNVQSF